MNGGVRARRLALWLLIAAKLIAAWGLAWDIRWHVDIGRDSFWIAPHVMIYAAVAVAFVVGFAVVARDTWAGGAPGVPASRVLGLVSSRGFHLAAWSIALVVLAAPIDDLWHRLFGIDVTLWSPPHLLGLGASAASTLACVLIAGEVHAAGSRAGLAAALIAGGLFYTGVRVVLEPTYLLAFTHGGVLFHAFAMLAALLLPLPLMAAAHLTGRRWGPVAIVAIAIAVGASSDAVTRTGFAIVQPVSVLEEEIRRDPASPIARTQAIFERNGRTPPPLSGRLVPVAAAAAMVAIDVRRRPIAGSVGFAATLFGLSAWYLGGRPAFQPMVPDPVETAVALAVTLATAVVGGVAARAVLTRLTRAQPVAPRALPAAGDLTGRGPATSPGR